MDEETWESLSPLLDEEPWRAWDALGPAWMIKWTTQGSGYVLVITDGTRGYIEARDAQYVAEKALEWASCVEAGPGECAEARIALLVLGALVQALPADGAGGGAAASAGSSISSSVAVTWQEGGVRLQLSAALEADLPFCWCFCLAPLAPHQVLQLVIVPLAVQLQCLTQQLQHKDQQLQQLRQKLADLTPDGGAQLRVASVNVEEELCTAAAHVATEGAASVLLRHLTPSVAAAVRRPVPRPAQRSGGASAGQRAARHRRQPAALARPRTAVAAVPLLTETEELSRREQIQALTQPNPAQPNPTQPNSTQPNSTQPNAATLPPKNPKKKKLKI